MAQQRGVLMIKNTIKTVFFVAAFCIILFTSYSFSGQLYHAFKLGKHMINGNEIEFTFPMPPPSKTLFH